MILNSSLKINYIENQVLQIKSETDNNIENQLNEKFSNNKIFKADAVAKTRARLKKKIWADQ
jgi:hypothetical protein